MGHTSTKALKKLPAPPAMSASRKMRQVPYLRSRGPATAANSSRVLPTCAKLFCSSRAENQREMSLPCCKLGPPLHGSKEHTQQPVLLLGIPQCISRVAAVILCNMLMLVVSWVRAHAMGPAGLRGVIEVWRLSTVLPGDLDRKLQKACGMPPGSCLAPHSTM